MRPATLAILLVTASAASALTPDERALLERSIRKGELERVEKATGGLDTLSTISAEIHFDPAEARFSGLARLDWRNPTTHAITELPLRLAPNTPDTPERLRLSNLAIEQPGGAATALVVREASPRLLWVTLPTPLAPGARVTVTGTLAGQLSVLAGGATEPMRASLGAMFSGKDVDGDYGTFSCGDGICTAASLVPDVPAVIDDAFDLGAPSAIGDGHYSEPRNVFLSVIAPSTARVSATGFEVGRVPAGQGRSRTSFALAAARDTAVVISSDFVVDTKVIDGVTVRGFSSREDRSTGQKALEAAASAIKVFDTTLGRYPWAQLDVTESALVGGAGGVELPGLALVGSGFHRPPTGLAAMADPTGELFTQTLRFITRHEVAHQWWHAQVGSHPQKHPYIDEPLAQWSAVIATRTADGRAMAARMREMQIAMDFKALALFGHEDGVVAREAGAFDSSLQYAGLVYGKAPLFYEAAEKLIGEERVAKSLREIVARWSFQRTTPDDLRTALKANAGAKGPAIDALWKRWFEQTHGAQDVGKFDYAELARLGLVNPAGGQLIPQNVVDSLLEGIDDADFEAALKELQKAMQQLQP